MKLLADKIRKTGWKIAGITGIRSLDDVSVLKEIFGGDFIFIRVYITDPKVRYSRTMRRAEVRDPHCWEEFLRQNKAEEELFSINEAEQRADSSIVMTELWKSCIKRLTCLSKINTC